MRNKNISNKLESKNLSLIRFKLKIGPSKSVVNNSIKGFF